MYLAVKPKRYKVCSINMCVLNTHAKLEGNEEQDDNLQAHFHQIGCGTIGSKTSYLLPLPWKKRRGGC